MPIRRPKFYSVASINLTAKHKANILNNEYCFDTKDNYAG